MCGLSFPGVRAAGWYRVFLCPVFLLLIPPASAKADNLAAVDGLRRSGEMARFLPEEDWIRLEMPRGTALRQHPFFRSAFSAFAKSVRAGFVTQSPPFDRFRFFLHLVDKTTGQPGGADFDQLTAGGVAASFSPGREGGLTLVFSAADAALAERFPEVLRAELQARFPGPQSRQILAIQKKNGWEYRRLGQAALAVVDRNIIFCTTESRLLKSLEAGRNRKKKEFRPGNRAERRLSGQSGPGKRKRGEEGSTARSAEVLVHFDLRRLRTLPPFRKALQLPAEDAGRIALLGGWLDLLRQADHLTAEIRTEGQQLELHLQMPVSAKQLSPELAGFFAKGNQRTIAPLLQLPGIIGSASWYRDYGALWASRRRLLRAATARKLEEADQTLQQQLSVLGLKVPPSRLFQTLGPHFRVAIARSQKSEYRLPLQGRLPAAVVAVDLRDEESFRRDALPLLRGVGLVAAFGPSRMLTRKSVFAGAELTTLRFPDDEHSASQGNRLRFQFSPTYTITRGHFIAGSTAEIVRSVIVELDRQRRQAISSPVGVTEMQHWSLDEMAEALNDFRPQLLLQWILGEGLDPQEADEELNRLQQLLKEWQTVTVQAGFYQGGFRYIIQMAAGKSPEKRDERTDGNISPDTNQKP